MRIKFAWRQYIGFYCTLLNKKELHHKVVGNIDPNELFGIKASVVDLFQQREMSTFRREEGYEICFHMHHIHNFFCTGTTKPLLLLLLQVQVEAYWILWYMDVLNDFCTSSTLKMHNQVRKDTADLVKKFTSSTVFMLLTPVFEPLIICFINFYSIYICLV